MGALCFLPIVSILINLHAYLNPENVPATNNMTLLAHIVLKLFEPKGLNFIDYQSPRYKKTANGQIWSKHADEQYVTYKTSQIAILYNTIIPN